MPAGLLFEALYFLPAEFVVIWLKQYVPVIAEAAGLAGDDPARTSLVALAAACWIAGIGCTWSIVIALRYTKRIGNFLVRTAIYPAGRRAAQVRTAIVCRLKRNGEQLAGPTSDYAVSFSSFDIAVLDATAKLAPAGATSAPELAEAFGIQPARVQESLEKLARNKLLDYAFGSTDGFENYVLSTAGAAYFDNQ